MFGTGFLAGLLTKLAGLGSVAKAAIGTVTAALTMTLAGGAAGVLPIPGTHSGPTVTVTTTDPAVSADATTPPPTSRDDGVQAGAEASGTTPAGSTKAAGAVGTAEAPTSSIPSVSIPPVTVPGAGLPDLSGLAQIPTQVLACFSPVLDLVKGFPAVPFDQLATIGPSIVSCVTGLVANLPLPSGMNTCVSSILSFVRNITSHLPTGTPSVGSFDVAACIPTGLPVPTGLAGLPFVGGGFPFGR